MPFRLYIALKGGLCGPACTCPLFVPAFCLDTFASPDARLVQGRKTAFAALDAQFEWAGWDARDGLYTHISAPNPALPNGPLLGGARLWVPPTVAKAQTLSVWEDFAPPPGALEAMFPVAELGRMWVHPDAPQPGAVLRALWHGVAAHLAAQPVAVRHLFSILALGPAPTAAPLQRIVKQLVTSTGPHPFGSFTPVGVSLMPVLSGEVLAPQPPTLQLPPLSRLAIGLGGRILGAQLQPHNPRVADVLVCIPLADVPLEYGRRFLPGL